MDVQSWLKLGVDLVLAAAVVFLGFQVRWATMRLVRELKSGRGESKGATTSLYETARLCADTLAAINIDTGKQRRPRLELAGRVAGSLEHLVAQIGVISQSFRSVPPESSERRTALPPASAKIDAAPSTVREGHTLRSDPSAQAYDGEHNAYDSNARSTIPDEPLHPVARRHFDSDSDGANTAVMHFENDRVTRGSREKWPGDAVNDVDPSNRPTPSGSRSDPPPECA